MGPVAQARLKMASSGFRHVKLIQAKSAWKKVEIPSGERFEDLIDFQELNEYELVGDTVSIVVVRPCICKPSL